MFHFRDMPFIIKDLILWTFFFLTYLKAAEAGKEEILKLLTEF